VAQGVPGRLRSRIFLTFRHYKGGRSSAKRTGRLSPRRNPWYSFSEAESTSEHMVLLGKLRKESPVTPPGIDPGTVRLVAQRLNHYATPGPPYIYIYIYIKEKAHLFFLYFIRHESSVSKATVCMTGSVVHSRYFIHRQTLERLSDLSPKCGDTNAITNAVN